MFNLWDEADALLVALTHHLPGTAQICDTRHMVLAPCCRHPEPFAVPRVWCHAEEETEHMNHPSQIGKDTWDNIHKERASKGTTGYAGHGGANSEPYQRRESLCIPML